MGKPKQSKGVISAPLGKVRNSSFHSCTTVEKDANSQSAFMSRGFILSFFFQVVVDNGKSERIMVIKDSDQVQSISTQHAITEYQVIDSCNG